MAYTYDDFLSYLPAAGLTEEDFSAEDLALAQSNPQAGVALLDAKFDWKNAQTDDERALANAKANQVRSQAGYSGGIDGMNGNVSLTPDDYQTSLPQPGQQGQGYATAQPTSQPQQTSFNPAYNIPQYSQPAPVYNAPDAYVNQYADRQQGLLDDMTNYKPFEYAPYSNQYTDKQQGLLDDMLNYGQFDFDPATSPLYSSYKKQYAREGNRAMQDTLGSLSAATGGRPSTAAMSAASQANDYHMSQLGDKLPQIYEQEYNKYLQDFGMLGQKLGAVNQMEGLDYSRYWDGKNFDYGRYMDDYGRLQSNLGAINTLEGQARSAYESDRNYGLDAYGQQRSDYNADRAYDYDTRYNELLFNRDADNTAYNRQQTADTTAYNRALDEWEKQYKTTQSGQNQQYRYDTMNLDAENTAYNRAMDKWQAAGTADASVAAVLGVPVGSTYGGEEAQLALEAQRANIAYTNQRAADVGKTSVENIQPADRTDAGGIGGRFQ